MGKKKKKGIPLAWLLERARARLIFRITIVYFLTLFILAFLADGLHIPLSSPLRGGEILRLPTPYLFLLWIFYYLMPFVVAALFGVACRPFWPQFRNLLVTIWIVQGLYSIGAYALRSQIREHIDAEIAQTKSARLKARGVSHEFLDEDKDGIPDKIVFVTEVSIDEFPLGKYEVYATITKNGEPVCPSLNVNRLERKDTVIQPEAFGGMDVDSKELWRELIQQGYVDRQGIVQEKFKALKTFSEMEDLPTLMPFPSEQQRLKVMASRPPAARRRPMMTYDDKKRVVYSIIENALQQNSTVFSIRFLTDPQAFEKYWGQGELEFNVGIRRWMELTEKEKKILWLNRWAPFLRSTSWEGTDPEIYSMAVDVDFVHWADVFK